jgi:hypothetical protein
LKHIALNHVTVTLNAKHDFDNNTELHFVRLPN